MVKVETEYGSTYMEVFDGMPVISGHREDLDEITGDPSDSDEVLHVDLSIREQLGVVGVNGFVGESPPDPDS